MADDKSVIICGNGPSLAAIDYRRFPENAQVWRVNKFFLEENYYVGRRIDGVVLGLHDLQMYRHGFPSLLKLEDAGEYDVNWRRILSYGAIVRQSWQENYYGFVSPTPLYRRVTDVIEENKDRNLDFALYFFRHLYARFAFPQSGTAAVVAAFFLGYSDIYLAGLDHDYTQAYPWDFSDRTGGTGRHFPELQWSLISKAAESHGVRVWSLSESSPAAKLFPMAPILRDKSLFVPQPKPSRALLDYTQDNPYVYTEHSSVPDRDFTIEGIIDRLGRIEAKLGALKPKRSLWSKLIVNLLCCIVPNRETRKRIRDWGGEVFK